MKNKKEKIQELKKKGKTIIEISNKLKIPYSTVCYHFDKEYKEKQIQRAKNNRNKRDQEKYKAYQRNYQKRRYKNDEEFREKVKERNRKNNKKYYQKKKGIKK